MKKPEQKKRGAGIATALIVATLVLMMGFTVAGVAFNHLNVSSRLSNIAMAENLAESAIAQVIEQVILDENFGTAGTETRIVTLAGTPQDAEGVITFSTTDAGTHGVDRCLNNLASDTAASADNGQAVPAEALYLVAVGKCGGVERRIEAMIHMPRFPYSIASSGPINGSGLTVAGLKDGASIPYGADPDPNDLVPGHLASNDTGSTAVTLTGNNIVKGDLKSVGGADLSAYVPATGAGTLVEGEQLLYSNQTTIPDVDIGSYRPDLADPNVNQSLNPAVESDLHIDNEQAYVDTGGGTMNVNNGLTLDAGVLYVEGNLHVTGGIHGKGAVIVTGNLTVDGGGSAASDNVAALLAGGNFTMNGGGGDIDTQRFEGLVYTEGDFDIDNMTVQGVFVANKSGGSNMAINNVRMYQQEEHSEITVSPATPTGSIPSLPDIQLGDVEAAPGLGLTFNDLGMNPNAGVNLGPEFYYFEFPRDVTLSFPDSLYDPTIGQHKVVYQDPSGNFFYDSPDGSVTTPTTGPSTFSIGAPYRVEWDANRDGTIQPSEVYTDEATLRAAVLARHEADYGVGSVTPAELDTFMLSVRFPVHAYANLGFQGVANYTPNPGPGPGPGPTTGSTSSTVISLSDFLANEDRMRIVYWKVQTN